MTVLYGLIGYPLIHSFSMGYFTRKFIKENIEAKFVNFEIESISHFSKILKNNSNLKGLSVTIPYKEDIIPFLDDIDDEAKHIGAVNSVRILQKNEKTICKGYNTDVFGFKQSLLGLLGEVRLDRALILGTGGASKAVAEALTQSSIQYTFVSRNLQKAKLTYDKLTKNIIHGHKLIINTTPLGTFPNVSTYPHLPYQHLTKQHYLYDLVYNPAETKFLQLGKEKGANIKNGIEMLYLQAERSWRIWNK